MKISFTLALGFSSLIVAGVLSCGKSSASGAKITTNLKDSANTSNQSLRSLQLPMANELIPGQGLIAGGTTSSGLSSLKYFISSISICNSLTPSGSGFSNQSGCIQIYTGPSDSILNPGGSGPSADYNTLASAARSTVTGFIDLMNPQSRAQLSSQPFSLTSQNAQSYSWGIINWSSAVKLTASATAGGTPLYTHDGNLSPVQVNAGSTTNTFYRTTSSTPFTSGPAGEAVVLLPNGGTVFKFQNPFVITSADISNNTSFQLDLTFNPDNLIKVYGPGANGFGLWLVDGTPGSSNAFAVPLLDLTPVPRKDGDTTMVETYLASQIVGSSDNYGLRLELYYLKSDPQKTIYGATLRALLSASTSTQVAEGPKISYIKDNADGSLDFQDWSQASMIHNFVRQSAVGGASSVAITCFIPNGIGVVANCPSSTASASFQLTSVSALQ